MRSASFRLATLIASVAVWLVAVPGWSETRLQKPAPNPKRVVAPEAIQSLDNQRRIDVNQMNMFVTNYGSFAYDLSTGNAGLIFPKGTNKTAVFASGLWLGARVGGETRVTVAEYSQEYAPGVILPSGAPDDPRKREYVVYKVNRFTGAEDTAHVERTANELGQDPLLDPILHHSWSEYLRGAVPFGAPTRTYRLANTLTAPPDDSVDVLGPDVKGDQMLWAVYNDAALTPHSNSAGNSQPLGVEIQQTTFGFNRQGALGNTLFLQFKIINKGTNRLDSTFVSVWSDPDLGGAPDDLVGSDTLLSLGYVYNATNNDQLYGISPPAVGYDFFLGPRAGSTTLPLTSFNKYINGTDPHSPSDTYCYMQGFLPPDNAGGPCKPLVDEVTGRQTKFFHPGDPVRGTGWLDSSPADRRFLMSSGPFTMLPGDTQTVVCAVLIARGSDRLSSISGLKFFDISAQQAFDRNFNLKSPPAQPKVTIDAGAGTVRLCWDAAPRLTYNEAGYVFEGFNVYQGASVAGPWTRLATFDVVDGVGVVRDTVFDANTGQLITDFPVAFGGDNGVSYCYQTSSDAVRGGGLREGTEYYFAVTSYSYSPTERDAILENAQQVIRVTPQSPPLGTNPATAAVVCPEFIRANETIPPTSDVIQVNVVDPTAVTGHTYKVFYAPLPAPVVIGGVTVTTGWNLIDVTTGEVKLANQTNKSGDDDYRIVDGLQVKIIGTYESDPHVFNTANYFDASCPVYANPTPPLTGFDFGGPAFGGGAFDAFTWFRGTSLDSAIIADSSVTTEIRFSHTNTQKAYRYFRNEQESDGGGAGRYNYGGFQTVPFTVWDVVNNIQLDAAFVERLVTDDSGVPVANQPATHDSTWGPDASDLGGREYLALLKSPYTPTPKPAFEVDAAINGALPSMYGLTVKLTTAGSAIGEGDVFRFIWGVNPGTTNDTIRFETRPLVRHNASMIAGGLSRIRVVPNPYRTRSRYELNQFNRIVRFINMPEEATVRIYTLSGQLIRTLRKTEATTSIMNWDLLTERGLPVASGIYVYHVESPAGQSTGRLVVFMEKERLNTF